jgi:hypothetical protein
MPQSADDDDTIRMRRPLPEPARPARPVWWLAAPIAVLIVGALGGWLLWRPTATSNPPVATEPSRGLVIAHEALSPPAPSATATSPPPPTPILAMAPAPTAIEPPHIAPEARIYRIDAGNEQAILDHVPTGTAPGLTVFHFAPNPHILVLDFTSLREQALMFNRAAAFVEKAGQPHDRLLSDDELDSAVRAGGDTFDTYYYGHDYGGGSLRRFFATADQDKMKLYPEEHQLRRLLSEETTSDPDAHVGLISIPQVGADEHVTRSARAAILHHELSHGEYFTNPAYAAFVHHFWTSTLSSAERDHIREHLRSLGYDPGLDELMENEAQAYLMFTYNPEFFTADMIGMAKGRLSDLRNGFFRSMPASWLRDSLGQHLSANKGIAAAHP